MDGARAAAVVAEHHERVARGEAGEAALRDALAEVTRWVEGGGDPRVLGEIYERCLGGAERHAHGVHFTGEEDLACVIGPTIAGPWSRRISAASTSEALRGLHAELLKFTVLDPACGSGNFLLGAFVALRAIEAALVGRLKELGERVEGRVRASQCVGIDRSALAAELAATTLRIADPGCAPRVIVGDALFLDWPHADAIVGNPPFGAKNKLGRELGADYVARLRAAFPGVSGRADYCVYFFRKAHEALKDGGRAGLIGTNTIGQNDSREGGLEYIIKSGGTIVDAVATRVWPGDAAVHVAVVNWVKGDSDEPRVLARQLGDRAGGVWERRVIGRIGASLMVGDVTRAAVLGCNERPKRCFQGQTHGCAGLVVEGEEAAAIGRETRGRWIFPYLIGEDLLAAGGPRRFVIDVSGLDDLTAVRRCVGLMRRLEREVLPVVRRRAEENPEDRGRQAHLLTWWRFWRPRGELVGRLAEVPRYVVCVRVTRRPIFAFVDAGIRPNDALQAFVFADDYSFGVLQSRLHWAWFVARCSTLKADCRYTSESVWRSFPWPQAAGAGEVRAVAAAGRRVRAVRDAVVAAVGSLRAAYRGIDGHPELGAVHRELDAAVLRAYGFNNSNCGEEARLLELNLAIAAEERAGRTVRGPGLPDGVVDPGSEDRVVCRLPWRR